MFYSLNFYYLGFSSSISGNLDVRLGCRHRCKDDRVRCGIEGLRRSGSRPVAKQRITPESHEHRVLIGAQIVELDSVGPVLLSLIASRLRHLATVLILILGL